jgi:hypothetical protein
MEIIDRITYHGVITSIRNNVDDKFIWFDIKQDNIIKKDGKVINNPSFFSARIYKEYKDLIVLHEEIYVKGIPGGYIDKKGIKQNYIHVDVINDVKVKNELIENNTISYDSDGVMLWNGKRCESTPLSKKEEEEIDKLIKEVIGVDRS